MIHRVQRLHVFECPFPRCSDVTVDGNRVDLMPRQCNEYQRLVGAGGYQALRPLVDWKQCVSNTAAKKSEAIEETFEARLGSCSGSAGFRFPRVKPGAEDARSAGENEDCASERRLPPLPRGFIVTSQAHR